MTTTDGQQRTEARAKLPKQAPLVIVEVPINSLKGDIANPRRISDWQLEALTRSLQAHGIVQPILARKEDGVIIGGHQRWLAARKLGYNTVPESVRSRA
jgi:ParB family chromosome partitioning protein